ncbi:MAG TPA: hypothetical protein VJ417_12880, partial [Candidatus Glassbacteria bacterium]|nr:hypothetical protein [Candidatus Glassbacteria bacterium]
MAEQQDYRSKALALREFKQELVGGKMDRALSLQREASLSVTEVSSVVATSFAELVEKQDYLRALEVGRQYGVEQQKMQEVINLQYGAYFGKGEFELAAQWAAEHNLSANEVLKAGVKIFQRELLNGQV